MPILSETHTQRDLAVRESIPPSQCCIAEQLGFNDKEFPVIAVKRPRYDHGWMIFFFIAFGCLSENATLQLLGLDNAHEQWKGDSHF